LASEAVAEIHWALILLVVFILIGIAGGIGVDSALRSEGYTETDDVYWIWQFVWCCSCCVCGLVTWVIIAVIFISTLPVNGDYTTEDVAAD
jgi:uncharacterized membrane protein